MTSVEIGDVVERLWARDATLWTGQDESQWLGWLDEPVRMRERVGDLERLVEATAGYADVVLLGMGGSSLAPEVLRRTYRSERLHVVDTTHPAAVRRLAGTLGRDSTLFVVASKSGTTLETRSHLDYFWAWVGGDGPAFVAVSDPGSELDALARERGFRAVFAGEPTIGGRYSALSVFGLLPAALAGAELQPILERAEEMVERCRSEDNPGFELGLALANGWLEGRDKVVISPNPAGFGMWAEQLLAESTGKDGKGLVPVPGADAAGSDRQLVRPAIGAPADLGAEFYRWEFATAVAGSIMGVNPFDQPNVQEAKERTNALLSATSASDPSMSVSATSASDPGMSSSVAEMLAGAEPPEYVAVQAFIDPARERELEPLLERARETGCAVTVGLGPRYLHSTGQLHKGGPPTGRFVQVVDDLGDEVEIPGRRFGFGRLLRAQADGDYAALAERGRPIARVRLEELAA